MGRYYGARTWKYSVPDGNGGHQAGIIILPAAGCGYGRKEDEQYARKLLRNELELERLPAGTSVWPRDYDLREV